MDDVLFSYGSEELSAILRVTDDDLVYQVLERFRKTIENYKFPQVGIVIVSIGYAKI